MTLRRSLIILFIVALPAIGWAQGIVVIGLPHAKGQEANVKKNVRSSARTQALALPFWDDFSATRTSYADTNRWQFGRSIRVNDGMAIRPPSIRVATFDGIDSLGKPYNINDILAKGYADKLVSKPIDLTTIPDDERDSVYLSYKYQLKGNGEIPDNGDRLLVEFFDENDEWVPMDTIENDGLMATDVFYTSIIKIEDPRFFHAGFQFRIKNFARLSGPYDTWHVDYIYLNKGWSAAADSFPDRTVSEPPTNLFGVYRAMPIEHFRHVGNSLVTIPKVLLTNLRASQAVAGQPVRTKTTVKIKYRDNNVITTAPQFGPVEADSAFSVLYQEFLDFRVKDFPDLMQYPTTADSLGIELIVAASTGDNVVRTGTEGDYAPEIFAPIDFRSNDTTRATFLLQNKYAYDDGVAEYGAALNQPGAQLAYEYNLVGVEQENITFLEMYFPRFGDESSQVIEVRIWDVLDPKVEPLYSEVVALQRSDSNRFWRKKFVNPIPVKSKFYIGWKQSAAAVIAVGLDKNNDTGDKMYYNVNGEWLQNTSVHGSLMLRPVFGRGAAVDTTGLEKEKQLTVYPNPGAGTFYFAGAAERITVYDMTGRSIPFYSEATREETVVTLSNASPGIYIFKVYMEGTIRTSKVMVR